MSPPLSFLFSSVLMLQLSLWLLLLSHQFQRCKPFGRAERWWFDNLCFPAVLNLTVAREPLLPPGVPTSRHESELKIKYIAAFWKQRRDKEAEAVVADTCEMTNERSSFSNTPSVHGRQSPSESLNARKKQTSWRLCFPDTPVMLLTNYFYLFSVCYFKTLMPLAWFSLVTFFWDEIHIF